MRGSDVGDIRSERSTGGDHRLAQQRQLAGAVPVERLRTFGDISSGYRRRRQRLDRRHGRSRRREFPDVRVLATENRGFAAANNRGLEVVDAEWVLFLNPDTRILSGTLEELVSLLRARPAVGLAGVRQVDENGVLDPTMRRFPNAVRSLFESLGAERLPFHASWLGERVLDVRPLRPRDSVRLDEWIVHARTQGGDRRRRPYGRAVLPLLRGDRLLPCGCGRQAGASSIFPR